MDGDDVATCDARSILARVQGIAASVGWRRSWGWRPEFFLLREIDGAYRAV